MKKIAIFSATSEEQIMLEQEVKNRSSSEYRFETFASFGQTIEWWSENIFDAAIIKLPDDLQLMGFFVNKLKGPTIPKDIPFIFESLKITQELLELSNTFKKVRIVKGPSNSAVLYSAIDNLLTKREPGKQQAHPRFFTFEPVQVHIGTKTEPVHMNLRNLSRGGAYIEGQRGQLLVLRGDMIRIQFHLKNVDKEYNLDARVVWVKDLDDNQVGIGCAFIGKEEVYNELLKNF